MTEDESTFEPATPDVDVQPPEHPEVVATSVEELVGALEAVSAERDDYLALARAKQAELENFRKQMVKRQADHAAQSEAALVEKLLSVLDTFEYGVAHGDETLAPVQAQLIGILEREGLERIAPDPASPFDPALHDAVAHEADDSDGGPVVAESLRTGYRWNGRLLRPAMVRVRG